MAPGEPPLGGCRLPDDRWYDVENDVWLQSRDGSPRALVGLTSPIVSFAGKFQRVEFRPVEGSVDRGRSVATVESVRYTGPVRLPVAGRIVGRNPRLLERAKLLNDAPYEAGWVVEIELGDPEDVAHQMLSAEEARRQYAPRVAELRVRCLPAAPDQEMYEIGAECSAIMVRLDEEIARREPEEVVLLVTDDPTSPIEMVRWSDRTGHSVLHHEREGNLHRFLVRKEREPRPRRPGGR